MALVYEPQGKAREYSPLALNLWDGCSHGCTYCYVPQMLGKFRPGYDHAAVKPKEGILTALDRELGRRKPDKQVLLSFTSDPYPEQEPTARHTRRALEILNKHRVKVAILTKGGKRCLDDLELFKQFGPRIKVGATLVFDNPADSRRVEPGGAPPAERLETLKTLHEAGIRTWVSFEPVIKPEQTLWLIRNTLPFVDQFKVGRWNHDSAASKIDWSSFLSQVLEILRPSGKQFYIKEDLRKFAKCPLTHEESTADLLALTDAEPAPAPVAEKPKEPEALSLF